MDKNGHRTCQWLVNIVHELDFYRVFEMNCIVYAIILKKLAEPDQVFDFLVGLENKFDKKMLSPGETISLIWVEKGRWSLMLDKPSSLNASTFVVIKDINNGWDNQWKSNKDNLCVPHWKKPLHLKEELLEVERNCDLGTNEKSSNLNIEIKNVNWIWIIPSNIVLYQNMLDEHDSPQ